MIGSISTDLKLGPSASSLEALKTEGGQLSTALSSSGQTHVLLPRATRKVVSLWTCSKLCAICFAAGVVVGFTLKRRVRRWASKLLKRLRDD